MRGQLLPEERKLLHQTVLKEKPSLVLEVGTWRGGGSTYQIATALEKTESGVLLTCEINDEFFNEAMQIYDSDRWRNIVYCHKMPSTQLIQRLITNNTIPDFFFEDGPEDPELNKSDLCLLEPYLLSGSIFAAHDWDLGTRRDGEKSIKSKCLRPYIEQSYNWQIEEYITNPISVGMVIARRC